MTKFQRYHLKNDMLVANFLANFIGVFFANAILFMSEGSPDKQIWQYSFPFWFDALFTPFAFVFVAVMTVLYEMPIRRYLALSFKQAAISRDLEAAARQRLLNAPFVLMGLGLCMWLLAATIYPAIHWAYGSGASMIQRSFFNALSTGVITATIAFSFWSIFHKSAWRPIYSLMAA